MFKTSLGKEWIVFRTLEDIAVVLKSLDKFMVSQVRPSDTTTSETFLE